MATNATSQVIQHLRQILQPDEPDRTDGQLLGCFIESRDEQAFAALVKRHGKLVWNVCRRLLSPQDAEDAFQATFLVLCRKAASIRRREMLASWLYGVAHHTALRARKTLARRKAREMQVVNMPEPVAAEQNLWSDLQPVLDQELTGLPENYQVVILLCDLEGKTRKEAARQLGVPEGTVAGRLVRARTLLAKRLARHGLALSGGALAAVLSEQAASAHVPTSVVSATIKAAGLLAAGQAAPGAISVKVATLTEGVLKTMLMSKLKNATMALVAAATFLAATASLLIRAGEAEPLAERAAKPPRPATPKSPASAQGMDARGYVQSVEWGLNKVDLDNRVISIGLLRAYPGDRLDTDSLAHLVVLHSRSVGLTVLEECYVAKNAKILIDGKEAQLKDLKPRMRLSMRLASDKPEITRIEARTPADAVLKAIDVEKSTIMVRLGSKDVTLPLAFNVRFSLIDKRQAQIGDLKPGMLVDLRLKLDGDKIVVQSIMGYK